MKPDAGHDQPLPESADQCFEECGRLRDELRDRGVAIPKHVRDALWAEQWNEFAESKPVDIDKLRKVEGDLRALLPREAGDQGSAEGDNTRGNGDLLQVIRPQISELFHDRDFKTFASIRVHGVKQVHAIESESFRRWLAQSTYRARNKGAANTMLEGLLQTLAAEAQFDGLEHEVFNRVGRLDDDLFIDLGNDEWSAVKVEPGSWSVVSDAPVKFWRPASAKALPMPLRGGKIDLLWKYVNVAEADRPLVLAWILATFVPGGPYPLLALQGEQGTAKSSAARFLKRLTDPSKAPLRSIPSNELELANAARHSRVLVFDNLSRLSDDMCDALCRLSTGGGITRRKLYTDTDEVVLEIQCPVIMTSITDLITRPDLADRTYHVHLRYIEPEDRRSERELAEAFERDAPLIVGALFDALALALVHVDTVSVTSLPRLADAARIAVAAEPALGLAAGSMEQALSQNSLNLDLGQLVDVPFYGVLEAMSQEKDWDLTPSDLSFQLSQRATQKELDQPGWPRSLKSLGATLDRIAPVLRRRNIEVSRYRTAGSNSQRMIRIRRTD